MAGLTRTEALTAVPEGWELHSFDSLDKVAAVIHNEFKYGEAFRINIIKEDKILSVEFFLDEKERLQNLNVRWKKLALARAKMQFEHFIENDTDEDEETT